MQRRLWRYVETDVLSIHAPSVGEVERMFALMDEYRDTPMDLADASLVAAAESLGISRIFTLDHHFRIYRLRGTQALEVVP